MARRNLTGVYTAPAHLLEVEEENPSQHVVKQDDYKNQRFQRKVDMEVKSYKQRMAENVQMHAERLEEPPRKRLRGAEGIAEQASLPSESQVPESVPDTQHSKIRTLEAHSQDPENVESGHTIEDNVSFKSVDAKVGESDQSASTKPGITGSDDKTTSKNTVSGEHSLHEESAFGAPVPETVFTDTERKVRANQQIRARIAEAKAKIKLGQQGTKETDRINDDASTEKGDKESAALSVEKEEDRLEDSEGKIEARKDASAKNNEEKNKSQLQAHAKSDREGDSAKTEREKASETHSNGSAAPSGKCALTSHDSTAISRDSTLPFPATLSTPDESAAASQEPQTAKSTTTSHKSTDSVSPALTSKTTPSQSTSLAPVSTAVASAPIVDGIALTDAVLARILPPGYVAAPPPADYAPLYQIPEAAPVATDIRPEYDGISMRPEDVNHFALLLHGGQGADFRAQDLVFRAKAGPPPMRKKAMRALRATARDLGAPVLTRAIVPVMLDPALDDAGRHILTKIVARVATELGTDVRPHVPQIVAALAPLLIDADVAVRLDAREAVSAVARAAGLASMVAALRPDLDHPDEYVRNITARVFGVAAAALGVAHAVPFVAAVVRARSAHARTTGVRIVRHMCDEAGGAAVLPHAGALVDVLRPALDDDTVSVRVGAAAALARLADCVSPHGAAAFEPVAAAAWLALRRHRGRSLAAFVRCAGAVVVLLAHDPAYAAHAAYYTRELVRVVAREFSSADDDMRRTVLAVVARLPLSLVADVRRTVVEPFMRSFWTRRTALDPPMARLVVAATVHLASVDAALVLERVMPCAKDASEPLRRMAAGAIAAIVVEPAALVSFDDRRDEQLVDAVVYAWQSQGETHAIYLAAVGAVCTALGRRLAPHVAGLVSTVLYRLKSSDPAVRQQAADVVARVAPVVRECVGDSALISKLILFLYEQLGEAYPEVLGSIVGALYACVATLTSGELAALDNPLVAVLVPTLTPILKNRHDKVQEQCVRMVGLVAQRSATAVAAKEWMRVGYDLLDMLKSPRRRVRVAANATFGYIAGAIGPADVVAMLLNNLQVQERQMRVCTAVALGIVADTCAPFTVLPALMNEYRVPDKNVQNAVLKAMSFMFEYLDGATSTDYLGAVAVLLEDALCDRDQVHRQTAATVVRHLALKCAGRAHDERHAVFIHLLNLVLPNIMESSPHVISRVLESLDALRIAVGPGLFLNYVWAGLFHAASKVRAPYWKVYNAAYVQHCDAIVPYYPRLGELPGGDYTVDVLDVWL